MFSLSRPQEKAHENGGIPLRALGWSAGLHALLLGALGGAPLIHMSGAPPAGPLQAVLQPAVAPVEPVIQPARHAARRGPDSPRTTNPEPLAVRAVSAVTQGLTFASRGEVSPVTAQVGGTSVARSTAEPATVALSDPRPESGLDAAGLRQYRLALAGEARRFRHYPDAARHDSIAGTAEVRVTVHGGAVYLTELARSSGHAVLDTAALDMIRAAATHAQVPDSLGGQAFAVLLPVVFEMPE